MNSTNQKLSNLEWEYIDSDEKLLKTAEKLNIGEGPVGIDVERASGHTYSQRAYLIQIFRRGSGTFLIDPIAFDSLDKIAQAISMQEWILHAAHSDLDSLAEVGLVPSKLYDTELASRLLGFEKVGLSSISESLLEVPLEKAFSRVNWSVRPLPEPWLEYAALDVVLLPDLRDATHKLLLDSRKERFAAEEFQALLEAKPKPTVLEPWRKISGYGRLHNPKLKNIAKELWLARDGYAKKYNLAPTRVLPNSAIIAAAMLDPRSPKVLARSKNFTGKYSRKELDRWWNAITKAKIRTPVNPDDEKGSDSEVFFPPNNIKVWEKKNPEAYARLISARELLKAEAERLNIPPENILSPRVLRALSWDPPLKVTEETISKTLEKSGARPWQRELTSHKIATSFVDLL